MKNRDLIKLLQQYDGDLEVLIPDYKGYDTFDSVYEVTICERGELPEHLSHAIVSYLHCYEDLIIIHI